MFTLPKCYFFFIHKNNYWHLSEVARLVILFIYFSNMFTKCRFDLIILSLLSFLSYKEFKNKNTAPTRINIEQHYNSIELQVMSDIRLYFHWHNFLNRAKKTSPLISHLSLFFLSLLPRLFLVRMGFPRITDDT